MSPFPNIKQTLKRALDTARRVTGKIRLEPNFLIIGVLRCGTTSLYNYLVRHPNVSPALKKEVHYFDRYFQKGPVWYRSHFPLTLYKKYSNTILSKRLITGEASANYIFHPHAPPRIVATIPRVRLLVLLRNPVDRTYSHYFKAVRNGVEPLGFEEALDHEEKRLNGERERILLDETHDCSNFLIYSYLARGIYVDQLKVWFSFFPRDQVLIVKSEDLGFDTKKTLQRVFDFLGLDDFTLSEFRKFNTARYPEMSDSTRRRLYEYYRPHNKILSDYLNMDFDWEI